jgi:hypothetical protein
MKNNIAGEEGQNPPVKRELSTNADCAEKGVRTPQSDSVLSIKNPAIHSRYLRSKRNADTHEPRDFIISRLAAGLPTNEDDVFNNFPHRYRRSTCMKLLRYVHQTFKKSTRLELSNSLWTIYPVYVREL